MPERSRSERAPLTVADIRASRTAASDPLVIRWLVRPIADLVTPPVWRTGLSPNAITYVHLCLSVAAIVLLALPGTWSAALAALLCYMGFVIDCVDGNVARLDDSATYYGKFIDGLVDAVFVLLAPVAAGLGVLLEGHGHLGLALGGGVTIVGSFAAMVRSRVAFFREWQSRELGAVGEQLGPSRLGGLAGELLVDGTFLAPALLVLPRGRLYFVLVVIVVQTVPDVVMSAVAVRAASRSLRHHRRSRHSSQG